MAGYAWRARESDGVSRRRLNLGWREHMKSIIVTSIAASSLLAGFAIAEPPRYTVTDLGTLGGTFSIPFGINNAGRVAGGATLPGGNLHPFLWHDGHMTDLGTLGGPNGDAGGPNARGELAVLAE